MCKSTKQNRAADSRSATSEVMPNAGSSTPPPAPNAFQGKPERVPQIAYVRERPGDGFLGSAKRYYEFFGVNVHEVNSIVEIIQHLGQQASAMQKVVIVSHAHPRGMIIPFFTNGVKGTNKEIFTAFAESDLRGLELLSPFPTGNNHLYDWDDAMGDLMSTLRGRANGPARLTPFSLQTSGRPNGNLLKFFKYCFDIVYLRDPGRVKRNPSQSGGLTGPQRTTLENFVGAILNALKPSVRTDWSASDQQVADLRALLTGLTYADLNLGSFHPHLGLTDDNMNDFPTLQAVPGAMTNFRTELNAARQKLDSSSWVDVRGCRAGEDGEYVEALRTFFGRPGQLPKVSAPRHFQSYPEIAFERPATRANITTLFGSSHWGHSAVQFKEKFSVWADLIRVRPLHTDFWHTLLTGRAARFAGLGWRSEIPPLFIPTPGLAQLTPLSFNDVIGKLKDYFNVPNGSVPNAGALSGMATLAAALPGHNAALFAAVADSADNAQLTPLFNQLRTVNNALGQSVVPATAPPLTPAIIRGYQNGLNDFLDTGPLAAVKTFMTAADTSLQTGDGLYYYMIFSGLPTYVFGKPQLNRNGLVVLNEHRTEAFQSWFKCLWADPLPTSGDYLSADITTLAHRQVACLVGEDRTSIVSICPLPRYMNCMRKRPLPSGEDESACGDITGPF